MTETDFIERLRSEFRRSKTDPESAAGALVKLARRANTDRGVAGVWCAQQSLGLAGMLYEQLGQPAKAARLFEKVAQLARAEVAYHSRAAASALAQASRLSFVAGRPRAGIQHAEGALQFLGTHPEPGSVYEDMLKAYRDHFASRSTRTRNRKK